MSNYGTIIIYKKKDGKDILQNYLLEYDEDLASNENEKGICCSVKIGRDSCNDIRVKNQNCSSTHCQITVDDVGGVWIENISPNGTYVNDVEIDKRTQLKNADVILITGRKFKYENLKQKDQENTNPNEPVENQSTPKKKLTETPSKKKTPKKKWKY